MEESISTYNRSELYTYKEAAEVVGMTEGAILENARMGRLTKVKLPNDPHKYVLREEIDPIAGRGKIMTKEVKGILDGIQKGRRTRDYVAEELDYGEAIKVLPPRPTPGVQESEAMRAFRMLNESLTRAFVEIFGNRDRTEAH